MNPWLDGRRDVFPPFIHLPIHPSICHPSVFLFVFADVELLALPLVKGKVDNVYVYFLSPLTPLGPFLFWWSGGWERIERPAKLQITAAIIDLTDKTSLRLINLWRFYSKNHDKHLAIRHRNADLLPETI